MTGHFDPGSPPDDVLAIIVDATKRLKAGEASAFPALAAYQSVAIDALLQEAGAMVIGQATPAIRDHVRSLLTTVRGNFVKVYQPADAGHDVKAAAQRFGLVAAIAEVSVRFGVMPWETGEIYRAAGSMFEAWQRSGGGGDIPTPPAPTMPAPSQSVVSVKGGETCSETGPDMRAETGHSIKRMGFSGPIDLAVALDRMGRPDAVTIAMVVGAIPPCDDDLRGLLTDRRHRRTTPLRFAECGYERVRNADATDGLWSTRSGKRVPIYARTDRIAADRMAAVRQVFDATASSTAPIGGVGEPSLDNHGGKNA